MRQKTPDYRLENFSNCVLSADRRKECSVQDSHVAKRHPTGKRFYCRIWTLCRLSAANDTGALAKGLHGIDQTLSSHCTVRKFESECFCRRNVSLVLADDAVIY